MRAFRYYVVSKETKKEFYTSFSRKACEEFIASLSNKENYVIGYKWLSI